MNARKPFEHGRYMADGGDVGGDRQLSAAPCRRFAQERADGTYTVVTEYAYVVPGVSNHEDDFQPRVHGYAVENLTESMHCRDLEDVGGTEITCDYTRTLVSYTGIGNKADALATARDFIRGLDLSADYGDKLY